MAENSQILESGSEFGNYVIERCLGQGGMGAVYRVRNSKLNRTEALKVINEDLAGEPHYRILLEKEAQAASLIDSPYVVKVWEQGEIDGRPYIALEFVSGKSLDLCFSELDFKSKLSLACQIADGLRSAHEQSLVHRDLKPQNIHLTDNKQIKILDFGLAKLIDPENLHTGSEIVGTHHYMSPEQLSGDEISPKSDMFSYGILLYEMFTGEKPFDGEVSAIISYAILMEDPLPPSHLNEEIPPWFDELILKLLAKSPSERFTDMSAVLEFIRNNMQDNGAHGVKTKKGRYTVTVMDLFNRSLDETWDYFCSGFTEDLRDELSKKTNLIVMSSGFRDEEIGKLFARLRSDFIVKGFLSKRDDDIKLRLDIYYRDDRSLVSAKTYKAGMEQIFDIRSEAVKDTADNIAGFTGMAEIKDESIPTTDINAYEYYLKGKSYYHSARPEDLLFAEDMFTKSLKIDPDFAPAHSGLADLYAYQYMAFSDERQKKIERAFEEAKAALEISPDLPEAYRALGRCHMFVGDHTLSEESLLKSIELNPKYALGYRTLAWLKEISGDHKSALYWTNMALLYAPNDIETLILRGIINMDMRKYVDATAVLHRAVELAPDEGRAYHYIGMVYLRLGTLEKALDNFLLGVKYGGDPNSYVEAGFIYIIFGDYEKAQRLLNTCIETGFFPFMSFYILGFMELRRGDREKAERYFRETIKSADQFRGKSGSELYPDAYQALAWASLGERAKAISILDRLGTCANDDGEFCHCLARGYALAGYADRVSECLTRALTEHAGPSEKELALDPHFEGFEIPSVQRNGLYQDTINNRAAGHS